MNQVIFIHIPKAAGQSVRAFAQQHSPSYQQRIKEDWSEQAQFTMLCHRSPGWFLSSGYISEAWWSRAMVFTIVRNPWDRLVSLYEYLRQFRPRRQYWKLKRKNTDPSTTITKDCIPYLVSFESFVLEIVSGSSLVKPIGKHNVRKLSQANPQVRWLEWGVDRILRFENLEHDWKAFCWEVGFPLYPLGTENTTKNKRDYRTYYTDDLIEQVGLCYKEDIDRFGYTFDGFVPTGEMVCGK